MNRYPTIVLLAVNAVCVPSASAQMGPGLDLSWNSLDCGGGTSTGGAHNLFGTIGQPDAGVMTGGGFELLGGFIGGGGGPAPCYPDCNASGTLTVADFGCFQGKYVLGDMYADCNTSGALTVADFGCFQGKYVLGCP